MRLVRRLTGVLVLTALVGGCETDEPEQVTGQTVSVTVSASNSPVPAFNAWDGFEDSDDNNIPDNPDRFLWCEIIPGITMNATSVPWKFSVELSLLSTTGTQPLVVSSQASLDTEANLAQYDSLVISGATPGHVPITVDDNGTPRIFKFTNGRRISTVNRDAVVTTTNPITTIDPSFGWGNGLCSNGDPGPADIDGRGQPFSISMKKGETLIVKARKALDAPTELTDGNGNPLISVQPTMGGKMFADGVEVQVEGESSSTNSRGAGIIMSYTLR